jgi:radical SAM superfamily enzyme YgiQ (UPF0313 family)
MHYEGAIYRPPSEADSLILQVSIGCSYNRCTFCGSFKRKIFRVRSLEEIWEALEETRRYAGHVRRVFLADGDALTVSQHELVPILEVIRDSFPRLERVGVYANTQSILRKSSAELRQLRELGLGIIYLGVETGDQPTLDRICKGTTLDQTAQAAELVRTAGLLLSVTVILGIAGLERSRIHAEQTGRFLTRIQPDFVGALSVMVEPDTPLAEEESAGRFQAPGVDGTLQELQIMIEHIDAPRLFFASNHASNYLAIKGWLPEQKQELLDAVEYVRRHLHPNLLRPEFLRGL